MSSEKDNESIWSRFLGLFRKKNRAEDAPPSQSEKCPFTRLRNAFNDKVYSKKSMQPGHSLLTLGKLRLHRTDDLALARSISKDPDTFETPGFLKETFKPLIGH